MNAKRSYLPSCGFTWHPLREWELELGTDPLGLPQVGGVYRLFGLAGSFFTQKDLRIYPVQRYRRLKIEPDWDLISVSKGENLGTDLGGIQVFVCQSRASWGLDFIGPNFGEISGGNGITIPVLIGMDADNAAAQIMRIARPGESHLVIAQVKSLALPGSSRFVQFPTGP